MINKLKLSAACLVLALLSNAQPSFQWAKQMGSTSDDEGKSVAVDASGNVYTTGYFKGIADFDPGAGTYTLASNGGTMADIFISKVDAAGNFVWAKSMGSAPADEEGDGIALDASGNVYITGDFSGTVDFDPGAASYTLTAAATDIFVLKLDASGNFVWARRFGGTGSSGNGYAIAVDASANVYTTGYFSGTSDFDPSTTTQNLVAYGGIDVFVSKLDVNGNYVWAKKIGGTDSDVGYAITADASGNVYTTGTFQGNCDMDPGTATHTVTSAGDDDIFISKLDVNGNYVWGESIVGGAGSNNDAAHAIAVDASGNVYTSGFVWGIADFNPAAATYTLGSSTTFDGFILKLDASGTFVWAKDIQTTGTSIPLAIAIDGSGNIYSGGNYNGTADFDPGAGTHTLTATGGSDPYILKLDASGNYIWVQDLGGIPSQSNSLEAMAVNNTTGNIYTTGYFDATLDFDFGPGNANLTPIGSFDIVVEKIGQPGFCAAPAAPTNTTPAANQTLCSGNTTTLTATGTGTVSWYATPTSTTALGTGTVYITASLAAGNYTYYAEALTCTVSAARTVVTVTVNITPTLTVNSGSICAGNSFTLISSGADTYTYSGGSAVVSPTNTATYSVTGISALGCTGTNTAVSTVTVNTRPTVSVNSGSVCSGNSFTIAANGANTYVYSSGSPVVTPTLTIPNSVVSSYSVTGVSAAGCTSSNTAISSLTVYALPVVSAVSNNTLLCAGQPAMLTAAGATSYTWNTGTNAISITVSPVITTTYSVTGTGNAGCRNTTSITQSVTSCTSLSETMNADNGFSIYPNPSTGIFTVSSAALFNEVQIDVFDVTCKLIISKQFESTEQSVNINIADHSKGIYVVKVAYAGTRFYKKIVVE